jgi:two-component sensor histidine kinase
VLVEVASDAAHTYISVTDSGPGLSDPQPRPGSSSIGKELIRALSRQVGAQLEFHNQHGLRVRLTLARL